MKNPEKVKMGKRSKAQGSAFEKVVRIDLEKKGWIVDRWSNNVEFDTRREQLIKNNFGVPIDKKVILTGKLIPAKVSWRRTPKGMFPMGLNSGFPDFVCMKTDNIYHGLYEVIGVESKMTGVLDKEEKLKCRWLLDNNVFSKILIARKTKVKNRIVVEYEEFIEIEKRMKCKNS